MRLCIRRLIRPHDLTRGERLKHYCVTVPWVQMQSALLRGCVNTCNPCLRHSAYVPFPVRARGLPQVFIYEHRAPPCGRRGTLMSVMCSVKAPLPPNEAATSPAATSQRKVLEVINDATKYVVLLTCFGLVLGLRSVPVVWSITGSIGAAFLCKVLTINPHQCAGSSSSFSP